MLCFAAPLADPGKFRRQNEVCRSWPKLTRIRHWSCLPQQMQKSKHTLVCSAPLRKSNKYFWEKIHQNPRKPNKAWHSWLEPRKAQRIRCSCLRRPFEKSNVVFPKYPQKSKWILSIQMNLVVLALSWEVSEVLVYSNQCKSFEVYLLSETSALVFQCWVFQRWVTLSK